MEVRDVFPQIIGLAAVQAHLLAARLQHGIPRNVPLQNVFGMAPADIVRSFKDCLALTVLAHCGRLLHTLGSSHVVYGHLLANWCPSLGGDTYAAEVPCACQLVQCLMY